MIFNLYKHDLQITNDSNYDKDVGNIQVRTMKLLNHLRRDGVHHITDNRHTSQDTYYLVHEHGIAAIFISPFGKDN